MGYRLAAHETGLFSPEYYVEIGPETTSVDSEMGPECAVASVLPVISRHLTWSNRYSGQSGSFLNCACFVNKNDK